MREIKFRAYSHDTKTMYPYAIQGFNGELWVHKNNPHNGEWKNIGCGNDEEIVDYSYELMQFTGLLDKNGKEIYEGDFIKYSGNSRIWEIYFDTENLQFRMKSTDKSAKIETVHRYPFHELGTLEIIGNIYENPELIKS